jgi:glycosyltransferase involved in cell wall biosynthesis
MNNSDKVGLPRVAVLIPTFQGEKYLEKQMKSILNQIDVIVDIYVCDDGSTDGTVELIEKLHKEFHFAVVTQTNRIGSTSAFFHLLNYVGVADFVAFSDQDDIWMRNKLTTSIKELAESNSELVFSRREHIDDLGRVIGNSPKINRKPTCANAAVQNVAFGNTQVVTKKGYELIRQMGHVDVAHFDSWVFLLITSCFDVSHVDQKLIQYRLHTNNQVGLRKIRHYRVFHKRLVEYEKQVDILLNVAGGIMRQDAKRGLIRFRSKSFKSYRFRFFEKSELVFRQNKLETFLLRLLLLFRVR